MQNEEQLYRLIDINVIITELRKNPLFEKYSKIFEEIETLPNTERVKYVMKNIVNKEKNDEHNLFIRVLLNTQNLIDIEKVIDIIIEPFEEDKRNKIKNSTKEAKIQYILQFMNKDYRDFFNILLLTGHDDVVLILDPSNIDLIDLLHCDPREGVFSFGDENPIELLKEKEKLNNSRSRAYAMNGIPKGYCYLLNNYFTVGTYKEMQRFRNIFHNLKFEVIMRKNMNAEDIYNELKELSQREELAKHNAFIFMSISHGTDAGEIYGFDENLKKIQDLMNLFNNENCSHLRRKPKAFFFNCCRGSDEVYCRNSWRKSLDSSGNTINQKEDYEIVSNIMLNLPKNSDFCITYSTLKGYIASVDWNTGSIFGDALAETLKEYAHFRDINGIITRANERIQNTNPQFRQRFEFRNEGCNRDLFFTPK